MTEVLKGKAVAVMVVVAGSSSLECTGKGGQEQRDNGGDDNLIPYVSGFWLPCASYRTLYTSQSFVKCRKTRCSLCEASGSSIPHKEDGINEHLVN